MPVNLASKAGPFGAGLSHGMLLVLAQCGDDLSDNFWRNLEPLQRFTEPVSDVLLPEPGELALPTMAGASVIDVLLLLHIAGEHAAVMGTMHQPSEGDIPLRGLRSVMT